MVRFAGLNTRCMSREIQKRGRVHRFRAVVACRFCGWVRVARLRIQESQPWHVCGYACVYVAILAISMSAGWSASPLSTLCFYLLSEFYREYRSSGGRNIWIYTTGAARYAWAWTFVPTSRYHCPVIAHCIELPTAQALTRLNVQQWKKIHQNGRHNKKNTTKQTKQEKF